MSKIKALLSLASQQIIKTIRKPLEFYHIKDLAIGYVSLPSVGLINSNVAFIEE